MEKARLEDSFKNIFRLCEEAKKAGQIVDVTFIDSLVEHLRTSPLRQYDDFTDEDWKLIKFRVESSINIDIQEQSTSLISKDVERWLNHKRADITWNYWNAYRELLVDNGRSERVINDTEKVIDEILDASGDPNLTGPWKRKGLVMGNVQSGKTQNYLGLINKGIDAGYKVIILLGGHLNELRKQTQERVDEGVTGRESSHLAKLNTGNAERVGVGLYRDKNLEVFTFTSTESDFHKNLEQIRFPFTQVNAPVVLVIKKWASVLKSVNKWITDKHDLDPEKNIKLKMPLLLIDDEADYASINTKKKVSKVTTINAGIRSLLNLFERSTYIGYTATPFANIFIDPEEDGDELIGDDLFPENFMVKMPIPDNYVGQNHFFLSEEDNDSSSPVIVVDDYHTTIPTKSNKSSKLTELSESLKDAVRAFLLVTASRSCRKESRAHNTMLVNMTHLTALQDQLAGMIDSYLGEIRNAADFALGYSSEKAVIKSSYINELRETFNNRFYDIPESFEDIYPFLKQAIFKTEVLAVHGKGDTLDYSRYQENGLAVIVVGGHKLSRGLTLEGLTVSYFTRNSKMYDTLMQMCRWFGYRPGYKDLCKLYLTEESLEWYTFISEAIQELYHELERMSRQKKTPSEFGLKVRDYPGSLLVTAKQKMDTAEAYTRSMDLSGSRIRRFEFFTDDESNSNNISTVNGFISSLEKRYKESKTENGSTLFYDVNHEDVIEFMQMMKLAEDEIPDYLIEQYIQKLKSNGLPNFRVCVKNFTGNSPDTWWSKKLLEEDNITLPVSYSYPSPVGSVKAAKRKLTYSRNKQTMRQPSSELGEKTDERLFLLDSEFASARPKSVTDDIRHPDRDFPGLIIYTFATAVVRPELGGRGKNDAVERPHSDITVGYSLSFPEPDNLKNKPKDEIERIRKNTKVSYLTNKVWRDMTAFIDDEPEIDEGTEVEEETEENDS